MTNTVKKKLMTLYFSEPLSKESVGGVNQRVNYPIKAALVELNNNDQIDVGDDLCSQIAELGLACFFDAWNNHSIQGKNIFVCVI